MRRVAYSEGLESIDGDVKKIQVPRKEGRGQKVGKDI